MLCDHSWVAAEPDADTGDGDVVDATDDSRFVLALDGHEAELRYERHGDHLALVHTGVPDELEGRGIGGRLVRAAVDAARARGLTLVPRCQFARAWLERHPDVADTVAIEWPSPDPPRRDHGS